MTALLIERKTPKLGQDVLPSFATNLGVGMADNQKCFEGGFVCMATTGANAGFAVPGSTATGLVCLGIAEKTVDNTIAGHTAGGQSITPRQGVFLMNNSTGIDLITSSMVGQDCYMTDDNVVALTSAGGTKSRAGVIVAVDSGTPGQSQPTGVWVLCGITGSAAAYGDPLPALLEMSHEADCCTSAALAAYTITAGVLTITANGVLAAIDGVTPAVGTRFLLANGAAAKDNGLWVVTNIGTAGTQAVMTRPFDYLSGAQAPAGVDISINQGTAYANTKWFTTAVGPITVDTTACSFFPESVTQLITLVTGFKTVTNVPIVSLTQTGIFFQPTNFSGAASTVSYRTGLYASGGAATVIGAAGTASASITALVAAGTFNTADIGTGLLTITNR